MRAPYGFNKAVLRHLGNIKVTSALVSAVRKGKRKNDTILMAIIEVDHAMTHGIPLSLAPLEKKDKKV